MIRWINENLGTASYNDAVRENGDYQIIDVRNLVDKEGNVSLEIDKKIEEGIALLRNGKKIVICCDYGISRSNTIAAGILSKIENISLNNAIKKVINTTGEKEIKVEMLQAIWDWAGENKSIDVAIPRIIITGASGFIGSELVKLLSDLYVLTPTSSELDFSKDHILLDMMVKEHQINTIIHLAQPRVYTTYEAFGKSLTMLKTVLDVCVANNIRLIYPSDWVIYEGYRGSVIANEILAPLAKTTYSHIKFLSEKLIESSRDSKGLSVFMLRLCSIYGAGKETPKFIWNFIDKCKNGQDIITHQYINGSPRLDLLHVRDLVKAIEIAARSGDVGAYNIGGGISISTEEVAQMLIRKTQASSNLSHSLINDYVANITMDTAKFSKKYDWHPTISIDDGLDELLRL